MFIEFLPNETYMHRLDVRTKVIGFTAMLVLGFLFQDPLYNLGIAVIISILAKSIKMPIKKVFDIIKPLVPIFLFIMLITSFTYSPERFHTESARGVYFHLMSGNRMGASVGGFLLGITFLIRIYNMVFISSILTLTTPVDDFLQFLSKIKLPYEACIIITTAIRFIPTMDKKRLYILEAQKARGAKLNEKGITGQIRAYLPIMVPMIINSILMANTMSVAMLNRGYGYSKSWTNLKEIYFSKRDYCAIALITAIGIVGIYIRYGLAKGIL
ncbi:MAG: cobalt ABC transporter permease [Clostridia bacterium BRH_c25]|nr:MAG: cobalt ABC transporter permease [Clostridia bacterium BRH_c25]